MRYWFDTEFQAWGSNVSLLSIGIVAEDGREYYAWNAEANWDGCEPWVQRNVIPLLNHTGQGARTYEKIRDEVQAFIGADTPEFWGYFADYDWVALCGLFGRLIDLPRHWPQFCLDLRQLIHGKNVALPPSDPLFDGFPEHHALGDARWTKRAWETVVR